ncbi:MAG: TonB-dependent siderophore receptor [Cyanobacteria bacterium P01_C01_bin.72]
MKFNKLLTNLILASAGIWGIVSPVCAEVQGSPKGFAGASQGAEEIGGQGRKGGQGGQRDIVEVKSISPLQVGTAVDLMAQGVTRVTGVKVIQTEEGLELILQTVTGSERLVPLILPEGNDLVIDILDATLAFAIRNGVEELNPAPGINRITVNKFDDTSIRVTITGENQAPSAEVMIGRDDLVLSISPEGATTESEVAEDIDVIATGTVVEDGYKVDNASTATRTDTPIRDIPQSIQVVPQQVLEDRNVRTLTEALETVSGVASGSRPYGGAPITFRIIRGFDQAGSGVVNYRNGLPDGDFFILSPIGTIEQVEVLKGPASVLFGAGEPGGIVNTVTKKPLSEPFYELAFEAGNEALYQPSIDLSGPLNSDRTLLYRFIASYQGSSDFQEFSDTRLTTIAPSITWQLGEQTNLDLYYEFTNLNGEPAAGFSNAVLLNDGSLTPRDFATYYPELQSLDVDSHKFGYTLEHEFNDNLQLRNNVAINLTRFGEDIATGFTLVDDSFLLINPSTAVFDRENYFAQIELVSKFETGAISHQVLAGFDFNRSSNVGDRINADTPVPLLDIRNPNYDIETPTFSTRNTFSLFDLKRDSYGLYLQDQIAFTDNLKLLVGGRYDWVSTEFEGDIVTPEEVVTLPTVNDDAFSPRIGLVYQPSQHVSLYGSFARSFFSVSGFDNLNPDAVFDPTRGTQYEIGVKTEFFDNRLSATLAAYDLTRTNVLTPNPEDPNFFIQTGEQRSRGIELDINGEILPGWDVTFAYALTDAEITEDNSFSVGNKLPNVPENQVSLWTTYEIQQGTLEGLGFGLGLFYIDKRQGNLDNSFQLEDYFRTDAALFYRRGRLSTAINMRNIFDVDAPAFAFSRTIVQRTEPFTIIGSISWEF